jgi:FixJ family two-component response regulator
MKAAPSGQFSDSVVLVVEDELFIREGIQTLLRSVSLESKGYSSATELFSRELPDQPSCLILDVRLPGLSGFDLQAELAKQHINIPIIFITGHGDISMSVKAMKAGAVEFLTKPVRDEDLLDAVRAALERDTKRREYEDKIRDLQRRYDALSERQQQVMSLVVAGLRNKQVATEIGIAEVTTKVHRHKLMKKLGAKTLADLVRMAGNLGLPHAREELAEGQINDPHNGYQTLTKLLRRL